MKQNKTYRRHRLKHYTLEYEIIHDGHDIGCYTWHENRCLSIVEAKSYKSAVEKLRKKFEFELDSGDGMSHHVCDVEPIRISFKDRTPIPNLKSKGIEIIK